MNTQTEVRRIIERVSEMHNARVQGLWVIESGNTVEVKMQVEWSWATDEGKDLL